MKNFILHPLACLTLCILALVHHSASASEERLPFADQCSTLLAYEKFTELENIANDLRAGKNKFPDGTWKLAQLYRSLSIESRILINADYEAELALVRKWEKAFPNSITAPVAEANILVAYAKNALDNNIGNPPTNKDGLRLFSERLAQAREVLNVAAQLPRRCPHWYVIMQAIALEQSWSRLEYDRLFSEAVAAEPAYHDFFFKKGFFMLWSVGGSIGETIAFSENARTQYPGGTWEIYARIGWSQIGLYGKAFFRESGFEWPKMHQGFEALMQVTPDSRWNRNAYCIFACYALDKETAQNLFQQLGDNGCDTNLWGNKAYYQRWKNWAQSPTPIDPP